MAGAGKDGNGRWIWPTVISALLVVAIFVFNFSLKRADKAEACADEAKTQAADVQKAWVAAKAELDKNASARETRIAVLESNIDDIKKTLERIDQKLDRRMRER